MNNDTIHLWDGEIEIGYLELKVEDSHTAFVLYGNRDDDPEPLARGYMKWDGCVNIEFDPATHWCGEHSYQQFVCVLRWAMNEIAKSSEAENWEPYGIELSVELPTRQPEKP